MIKIALYAGTFKENQDGATKTLYQLSDSILKNDFDLGVWAFSHTPLHKPKLTQLQLFSVILPLYKEYRIAFPTYNTKKQLDAYRPDLIHITVPDLTGMFFMKYARSRNIPVLTTYHTDFPSYLKSYHLSKAEKTLWNYFKWFYNKSNIIFVPTNQIKNRLSDHGIKNIKIWSRGINLNQFNPKYRCQTLRQSWGADNKKVILYAGRFVWYKDIDVIINVYRRFKSESKDKVMFVLAGDGPIRGILKKQMPDAQFPGYITGVELSRVYASCDILLFPSTTETFGNVIQEALASGLPCIVSNIGGCQEIVANARAGYICKAKNNRDFFNQCKKLVENEALFQEFRQNGLDYAQKQQWNLINQVIIDEYKNLTNHKP